MSQNFIDIFKASCVKLAHSVIINHPYAGMVINKRLFELGFGNYTNNSNKETWKYYLNMAGIYHAYDSAAIHKINKDNKIGWIGDPDHPHDLRYGDYSNKMIIRVASDEGTKELEFTKENISGPDSDENLAVEFQTGTLFYNDLLSVYPQFEALIKGILHPIPLNVSTNADDFSVLYCGGYYRTRLNTLASEYAFIKGKGLIYNHLNGIEEWEHSLIDRIEEFTKTYFRQHDNRVYAEYNDLYFASSIGIYYLNLPMVIFNIRLEKIKTLETHSMHVQMYLDSYINLGQYMVYLTRAQSMYLYQNVEWLACNTGKQKVFDDLVNYFLKDRGVAVIVYDGYHDTDKLGIEEEPTPIFIRDYDDGAKIINTKTHYTPKDIIGLEKDCARDNDKYVEDQITRVTDASLISKSSKFKTKIIETQLANQMNNPQYLAKIEFLFNNWIWSSLNDNEYTGLVSINFPNTVKKVQLTTRNAMFLFFYCYGRGFLNIHPFKIPTLLLHHIPKTKEELEAEGGLDYLRGMISDKEKFTEDDLVKMYDLAPLQRHYRSTGQFNREMEKLWNQFVARNYVAHANPYINASAEIKRMVDQLYHVKKITPDFGQPYFDSWVRSIGLDLASLDKVSYQKLANALIRTALGIEDEDEIELTNIHKALINIVKTFTSYNIQFITNTITGDISNLGVNYLRVEHVSSRYMDDSDVHICKYPDYESIVQSSAQECVYYKFGMVGHTSDSSVRLLTQEQLQVLVTSEDDEGFIIG